jgi:hypothetical protein
MKRLIGVCLIVALQWCVVGCDGDKKTKAPDLAKVSGTVNLDGKAMEGGEVRFSVPGQPPKSIEIKNGTFSGEVFIGKNSVEVVWDVDGPPNPMDPTQKLKVNKVATTFSGPNTTLSADITKEGKSDLKFDVTSVRR